MHSHNRAACTLSLHFFAVDLKEIISLSLIDMSSLAFYAAPIEEEGQDTRAPRKRGGKKKNATIRKRPDPTKRHVAAMIEHIHAATGTDPDETGALSNFNPPPPPELQSQEGMKDDQDEPVGASGFVGLVGDANESKMSSGSPEHDAHARDFTQRGLREAFSPPYYSDMGNSGKGQDRFHSVEDRDLLLKKLDYMIHLLEEQKDERTGHVAEEVVLYSFLGIFIIFMADSFARAGKYVR